MISQTAAPASALRAQEDIFAYWASRRRWSRLPSRRDIEPMALKRHLPTVSLIDIVPPGETAERDDFRFRLAGTGLYPVFGREITGLGLDQVYPGREAEYWRTQLETVARERRPAAGQHSLAWRGVGRLAMLWLRLPLSSDGETVDMILGYDAVIGLREDFQSGIRAA
jgi:hypothetical protein